MKITKSQIIALLACILLVAWFLFHNMTAKSQPDQSPSSNASTAEDSLPTVVAARLNSEPREQVFKFFGQSEANRQVTVRASTASVVVSTPLTEGQIVRKGQVMCVQSVNERDANVEQTRAQMVRAELEYEAARKLAERGFRSETQVVTLKAAVDAAKAGLKAAEVERNNVKMIVPFRGIFERQIAQIGDYLNPGQACGLVVELDPLIVTIQLTEQQLSQVKTGQDAKIKLATGEHVTGKLRRIEAVANPSTRSFRTEIMIPNKDMRLKAGVTADVSMKGKDTVMAQNIPTGILSLDDAGNLGVRYLDRDDIVRFAVTTTIDEDENGIWVTGLPDTTRIIIKGQDYVSNGTKVTPTLESN